MRTEIKEKPEIVKNSHSFRILCDKCNEIDADCMDLWEENKNFARYLAECGHGLKEIESIANGFTKGNK